MGMEFNITPFPSLSDLLVPQHLEMKSIKIQSISRLLRFCFIALSVISADRACGREQTAPSNARLPSLFAGTLFQPDENAPTSFNGQEKGSLFQSITSSLRSSRWTGSLTKNEKPFSLGEANPEQETSSSNPAPTHRQNTSPEKKPKIASPENRTGHDAKTDSSNLIFPDDPFSTPSTGPGGQNASPSPAAPTPGSQSRSSRPSYSHDSREWVEFYATPLADQADIPSAFQENRATEDTSGYLDSFSSNEVSPVFQAGETPAAPVASPGTVDTSPQGPQEIRIASSYRPEGPSPEKRLHVPNIDLTPSYSKHLKYTSVCGVVVVQSNFPLKEIESILLQVEDLQKDLNLYMGVPAPREKIELCLFKDEKTYNQFLREYFPRAPQDRRALYIKMNEEPGTLLVQKTKEFSVDLRHEMTHAIIHASIRTVPIWLDEGLAKYFEPAPEERASHNPYLKIVRWNTRFGAVPSLSRLERLEHIGEMGTREYRDSWAWIHFMIHHSPDTHRLLAGYLQMLAVLSPENNENKNDLTAPIEVPPLSLYLREVLSNSREQYREHFQAWGTEEN